MKAFLLGSDLWANICGGVAAALFLGFMAFCINIRKHVIINRLIKIMGQAIQHRNIGEPYKTSPHRLSKEDEWNESEWVQQAIAIHDEAVNQAYKLSPSAGALVDWLDRVDPWTETSQFERYLSILNKVIERIRGILEQTSGDIFIQF